MISTLAQAGQDRVGIVRSNHFSHSISVTAWAYIQQQIRPSYAVCSYMADTLAHEGISDHVESALELDVIRLPL